MRAKPFVVVVSGATALAFLSSCTCNGCTVSGSTPFDTSDTAAPGDPAPGDTAEDSAPSETPTGDTGQTTP
jgi:hypothetical protein